MSWKKIYKNLVYNLSQQKKFGQSKHKAKAEARSKYIAEHGDTVGYNPSKVDGIFSISTYETYKRVALEFSKWVDKQGVTYARDITREHAEIYLKLRNNEGKSAWTVSRDMAALNKIFGFELNKAELGLKTRNLGDIKRSRNEVKHDRYAHQERYLEQVDFAKATGCRRQSIEKVTPADLIWKNDRVVAVHLVEKGGKERVAPVLNSLKDRITEIANNHLNEDKLFDSYGKLIDNHSFRSDYANNLAKQLTAERKNDVPYFEGDFFSAKLEDTVQSEPIEQYLGYDEDICRAVSEALGHNRLDVLKNYLR